MRREFYREFLPTIGYATLSTMRLRLVLICLLLAGCAHRPARAPAAPAPPPLPAAAPAAPETNSPAEPPSTEETTVFQGVDLRQAISAWISEHEEADFELVTRMANRFMRRHGYPLALDAAALLKPGQDTLRLNAGGKTFVFHAGRELALGPDVCGERYLRVPARLQGDEHATLVSGGRAYPFSLKPFRREAFRVFRGRRLVSSFFAPEPTEPIGISGNGRALFLRFPLEEQLTIHWWQRIARHQPSVLDEEPYLVLRVSKKRLYFDENIEHLPSQELEVDEETAPGQYHWRFLPSGFVLELSSNCDD